MNDSTDLPPGGGLGGPADKEEFNLEKSKRYWKENLDNHNCRLCIGRLLLLILLILIYLFAYFSGEDFINNLRTKVKYEINIPVLTVLFFLFGFITYVLRLIGRYLYQEHVLRSDAELRLAMIETYFRLMRDGAITEEERIMILEAMFRPPILPSAQGGGMDINMVQRHLRPPSQ